MSKAKFELARSHIKARRYDEARAILESLDHPIAKKWLQKLEAIAPRAGSRPPLQANSLSLQETEAQVAYQRGMSKLAEKDIDGAASAFQEGIRLNANHGEAYYQLSNIQADRALFDDAITNYEHAIRLDRKFANINPRKFALLYFNRGRLHRDIVFKRTGDLDREHGDIPYYNKSIVLNPNFAAAYYHRSNAYGEHQGEPEKLEDLKQAFRDINQALKINPQLPVYGSRLMIAWSLEQAGVSMTIDEDDSDEYILEQLRDDRIVQQDEEFYYLRGQHRHQEEKYHAAINDFVRAIRLNPQRAELYESRAYSYMAIGEYEKAINDAEHALRLCPELIEPHNIVTFTYHYQAASLFNSGNYDAVIVSTTHLLERNPKWSEAYSMRGEAFLKTGKPHEAIQDFKRYLELGATEFEQEVRQLLAHAYFDVGLAQSKNREYPAAVASFQEAVTFDPTSAVAYHDLAIAKHNAGDVKGAIVNYDTAAELAPQDATVYFNRAQAKQAVADPNGAVLDYTQAIHLNPDYTDAYYKRAVIKSAQGDLDWAIADYNEVARIQPQHPTAYDARGLVYYQKGDVDHALADYLLAMRTNPTLPDAYLHRGNVRRDRQEWDSAISDYTEAIRLAPKLAEAYLKRSMTWHEKGEVKKARADLATAIQLHPDYRRTSEYAKEHSQLLNDNEGDEFDDDFAQYDDDLSGLFPDDETYHAWLEDN